MYAIAVLIFCHKKCDRPLTCGFLDERSFSPLYQTYKYVHTGVNHRGKAPRSLITPVETLR